MRGISHLVPLIGSQPMSVEPLPTWPNATTNLFHREVTKCRVALVLGERQNVFTELDWDVRFVVPMDGTKFAVIFIRAVRSDNNSATKVNELKVISSGSLFWLIARFGHGRGSSLRIVDSHNALPLFYWYRICDRVPKRVVFKEMADVICKCARW
jgi:hypothetical protein